MVIPHKVVIVVKSVTGRVVFVSEPALIKEELIVELIEVSAHSLIGKLIVSLVGHPYNVGGGGIVVSLGKKHQLCIGIHSR